jgi:methylated-DNA-[protein]-cysteine S-methyltransferase
MTMMTYSYYDSPIGHLLLAGDEEGLRHLHLDEAEPSKAPGGDWLENPPEFDDLRHQLDEYFAGKRRRFIARLAPQGTEFQRAVWQALLAIPFGRTESYSAIAARVGRPRAVRAVGAANGANPIAIVIPCHRVLGRDGSLTGYAGGLARKEFLLRLEGWKPSPR